MKQLLLLLGGGLNVQRVKKKRLELEIERRN